MVGSRNIKIKSGFALSAQQLKKINSILEFYCNTHSSRRGMLYLLYSFLIFYQTCELCPEFSVFCSTYDTGAAKQLSCKQSKRFNSSQIFKRSTQKNQNNHCISQQQFMVPPVKMEYLVSPRVQGRGLIMTLLQ